MQSLHAKISYERQQRRVQYQHYDWSQFRHQLTQQDSFTSIAHLVIGILKAHLSSRQQLVNS